jgi:hypothetical protein
MTDLARQTQFKVWTAKYLSGLMNLSLPTQMARSALTTTYYGGNAYRRIVISGGSSLD